MSEQKMREEFEQQHSYLNLATCPDYKLYVDGRTRELWSVWQAACASKQKEIDALPSEIREWVCIDCNTVYPGPPSSGFSCVICPKCSGRTMPKASAEKRYAEQQIRELAANLKVTREALGNILPMAKGYAHTHRVGANAKLVADAENMLTSAPSEALAQHDAELRKEIARLNHQHANDEAANRMLSEACARLQEQLNNRSKQ